MDIQTELKRLAKALQAEEKGKIKLKLIGYSMSFRRKARKHKNKKYSILAKATKNLAGVL